MPDTPPQVPVPPFLFKLIVNVFGVHFAYAVPAAVYVVSAVDVVIGVPLALTICVPVPALPV